MRVAIATCRPLPEPDPDEELLLDALGRAGADARMLDWRDEPVDLGDFDLCVVRSTWDYYRDPAAFEAWIGRADRATRLANPARAMRWNLHKGYLRELEARGVPVVPTAWVDRGAGVDLARIMGDRGWTEVVVKPAVSAASYRTRRFSIDEAEAGSRFLGEIATDGDAMVQRYMRSVEGGGERDGERSLVWIDGELTHAIRKAARFGDDEERVSEALEPTAEERGFAERTLRALDGLTEGLLYARVDVMRDDAGRMVLSELELIEPSLFLKQRALALQRLAFEIARRAAGHRR